MQLTIGFLFCEKGSLDFGEIIFAQGMLVAIHSMRIE